MNNALPSLPASPTHPAKNPALDSLRGLAAVIVVLAHFAAAFFPYSVFGDTYQIQTRTERFLFLPPLGLLVAGQFAVALFFLLSGYVLSCRFLGKEGMQNRLIAAVAKRPLRLGGLVVFTILVSGVLQWSGGYHNTSAAALSGSVPWFSRYWNTLPTLPVFLSDLLWAPFTKAREYNPPLWTISTELYGSYLVFGFLLLFGHRKSRLVWLMVLLVACAKTAFVGFVLGILFAEMEQRLQKRSLTLPSAPLLGLLVLGLFMGSYPGYASATTVQHSIYGWLPKIPLVKEGYALLGSVLVFGAVLFCKPLQIRLNQKALIYLGRISYPLYALHFLILGSVSSALYTAFVPQIGQSAAFAVTLLLSGLLLILCADRVEHFVDAPVVNASNRLGKACEALLEKWHQRKPLFVTRPALEEV